MTRVATLRKTRFLCTSLIVHDTYNTRSALAQLELASRIDAHINQIHTQRQGTQTGAENDSKFQLAQRAYDTKDDARYDEHKNEYKTEHLAARALGLGCLHTPTTLSIQQLQTRIAAGARASTKFSFPFFTYSCVFSTLT